MEIFSEKGIKLDVCGIVAKYFWIKPNMQFRPKQQICFSCWDILLPFHQFYQRIVEAHSYLESRNVFYPALPATDPLPYDMITKFENIKSKQIEDAFFDAEVKVEVHDLDLLPKVEIIEENQHIKAITTEELNSSVKSNERTLRASKRKKILKQNCEVKEPTTSTKKRKIENHIKEKTKNGDKICQMFKCTKCDTVFEDLKSLKRHRRNMHTLKPKDKKLYPCQKCDKVLTTKTTLEYHINAYHVPESEFRFLCKEPDCNKKFPSERKLKDHLKMHDPECTYICDKCGKIMRNKSKLKKHHQMVHSDVPPPAPEPKQCPTCNAWLKSTSGLRKHIASLHDTSGVEHRCHICNKVSTNAQALKRHIFFNHECERKFKCTMCEKAFKRPTDLKEHISTHTGEVLYTCPYCPMTFISNANMYKHRHRAHRVEWEADRKKPITINKKQEIKKETNSNVPNNENINFLT